MRIDHQVVVFDAADLATESSFWAGDWPDGTPPQQMHLDLWVEDFPSAHDRVMSLGAGVLKTAEETDENFQVYADPAGHPFCLCWVER